MLKRKSVSLLFCHTVCTYIYNIYYNIYNFWYGVT
jgi:hypothetical protein